MKYIGVDIESIGTNPVNGTIWSIAASNGKKYYHLQHDCNGLRKLDRTFTELLEDETVTKIFHNALFDIPYLTLNAVNYKGKPIVVRNVWDTDLAEQVIISKQLTSKVEKGSAFYNAYSTALKPTCERYGLKIPDKNIRENFIDRPKGLPFTKDELNYMRDDVVVLPPLMAAQQFILVRDGLMEVALLENKFLEVLIAQKINGVGFDSNAWRKIAQDNQREYNRRLNKLPKEVSNWNSEKQVKQYFKNIGIHIPTYDDLETIYKQTGNQTLADFISMRELHKSVTSYGLNWFEEGFISPNDGKLRPRVRQIIETGRNSISDPPMHNLPKKGLHRSAIVPHKKGNVFVIGDFTGQEIGIMAAMSGEENWINACLRGDDIHSLVASMLYESQWDNAKEKQCKFPAKCSCKGHVILRDYAKTLNFMLAYGGGPKKFSERTGLSFIDAKIIVKRYKKIIPRLTNKLEENGRMAVNTGETYSADPYRRRRILLGDEEWHITNQGKNSPIQMAGANMMKLAAISVPKKYYIPLIVHDEIVLDVPRSEGKAALKTLKKVMEQSADYITGIKGLIKVEPRIATNFLKI